MPAPDVRTSASRQPESLRQEAKLRWLFATFGLAGSAFIPFYVLLLRGRGLHADEIGLVLAITSLAGVTATPFWSHAADTRLGGVHTLQLASGAACVGALAMLATGSSILAIGAAGVMLGAAQGPQTAMTDAIALAQLGPLRVTEYGSVRLWASGGWAVGAVAFGALFASVGLRPMLPIYAAMVAAVALFASRLPRVRPPGGERAGRLGSIGQVLRTPRVAPFLAGVLVLWISTHAAWDFVPLRIVSAGGGAFLVGLASSLSAVLEIPLMRSSGSLASMLGLRGMFAAGVAVYVAASVAWALVDQPVAVTAVRVATGIGFGLVYVALVLMTGRLVPDRVRVSGQALLSISSFGLAPVVGGAVGGFVYRHVGPAQLFAGSALGIAIGGAAVWLATARIGSDRAGTGTGSVSGERAPDGAELETRPPAAVCD